MLPYRSPEQTSTPELEFRAAEALHAQTPALADHVHGLLAFIERLREPARDALTDDLRVAPALTPTSVMRLGAVDSSHRALSRAGLSIVFCAAFRTSDSNSEDHRFAHAPLDPGGEAEPVARLMRSHMEAELLRSARQGDDQLLILDNSFLSLAMAASQAQLAYERADAGSLTFETLAAYFEVHLGTNGSLLELLRNARVVALPKIGSAQGLIDELYDRIGLAEEVRRSPAGRGQHDRLLLRHVLEPGEYLAPRPLVPTGWLGERNRRRFFGEFPGRDEVEYRFGIGTSRDEQTGIDVVYFRPRRASGAAEGPVLRVELHRAIAQYEPALHHVLATLEEAQDGEHPEPVPQLLADHYAKGAVRHAPDALSQAVYGGLLADGLADSAIRMDIVTSIFQEQRS